MKFIYIWPMIMEAFNAIVNLKCKCPICGGDAITMTKAKANRRKMHIVCTNEYYTHYQWAGKHYLVREAPSEILEQELSLC